MCRMQVAQAARPGVACEDLYNLAMDVVQKAGLAGYFMGCRAEKAKFIGHGIGLEINESPVIAPRIRQGTGAVVWSSPSNLRWCCPVWVPWALRTPGRLRKTVCGETDAVPRRDCGTVIPFIAHSVSFKSNPCASCARGLFVCIFCMLLPVRWRPIPTAVALRR